MALFRSYVWLALARVTGAAAVSWSCNPFVREIAGGEALFLLGVLTKFVPARLLGRAA